MNIFRFLINKIASVKNWFGIRSLINKILILLVVFGILGFGFVRARSGSSQKVEYQTATVEKGTIVTSVSASGSVLTANVSNINTGASGVVTTVYVRDGDTVIEGQKIAEIALDTAGAQKNVSAWSGYLSAKNAVDSANVTLLILQSDMLSKWDEFKELAEGDEYSNSDDSPRYEQRNLPEFKIPEADWLAAEAKYKNQQAVITQTQAALNSSWLSYKMSSPTIYAPMAGTITNITVVSGMTLTSSSTTSTSSTVNTSGERVAVIRTEGKPLISVDLSEIDVPQIEIGQKVTVTVDAIADKTFTGHMVSVDRIGATTSGVTTYPAIIELDTNSEELLPNMAVSANILLESKSDVLLVPTSAIQTQNDSAFARVLQNGREQLMPIETGAVSDSQTEVISGLTEGDEVITGTASKGTSTSQSGSVFGGFGGGGIRMVR